MKILLSAHSCNPCWGSESHFGWQATMAISAGHETWVFVTANSQKDIEDWLAKNPENPRLHFVFVGKPYVPHPNRLIARLLSWRHYIQWTRELPAVAAEWHRKIHFDVAHHVTVATWRVAPALGELGIPFVFGPVGGGEIFPWRLFGMLSFKSKLFELVRKISNGFSARDSRLSATLNSATLLLAANRETAAKFEKIVHHKENVRLLSPAFFSGEKMAQFKDGLEQKNYSGKLRIFAGGMMEARKGFYIAFQALAKLHGAGVDFEFFIGGNGPDRRSLTALRDQLGLRENIIFNDGLRGEDYVAKLRESHVFLLPSLRESAGLTMMEAMLAGCVPVVARCGGPADIVTDECGWRVPISTPEKMANDLANILSDLDQQRDTLQAKGALASQRIEEHYSAQHYAQEINRVYEEAVKKFKIVRATAGACSEAAHS